MKDQFIETLEEVSDVIKNAISRQTEIYIDCQTEKHLCINHFYLKKVNIETGEIVDYEER